MGYFHKWCLVTSREERHTVETSSRCQGTSHFSVVTLSTQNACNYSVSICFSTQVVLSVGCTLELLHTFNKTVLMPGWHSRDSNLINLRVGYGDQDFLTLVTLLIKASTKEIMHFTVTLMAEGTCLLWITQCLAQTKP